MDILVVEDDAISARALSRLLKFKGHAIEVAATCREALAAAEMFRFDLAILDLTLPDGDGCDLLAKLLTQRPVKSIALTGHSFAEETQRIIAAGFNTYLLKPVTADRVYEAIEELRRGPQNLLGSVTWSTKAPD